MSEEDIQLKDIEIAKIAGLSPSALSRRKSRDKQLYEVIRLGATCKKYEINEAELLAYLYWKGLICGKNDENKE